MSEHKKHDQLEEHARIIDASHAERYQTLNTALARQLGYTRSSTVKGFVYQHGLPVYKYFQNGKWFLAITHADAQRLTISHSKKQVHDTGPLCIGNTDVCGLCGDKWTIRCNIHKFILSNGVQLYCCTRCRNVREVCDDATTLRKIADGLDRTKK